MSKTNLKELPEQNVINEPATENTGKEKMPHSAKKTVIIIGAIESVVFVALIAFAIILSVVNGNKPVPHVHVKGAPTCTEPGVCIECGEECIKAKGHTVVTDEAVAATCTETGFTVGTHCSVCNKVISQRKVTPMLEHTWVDGKCTECGFDMPE